MRLLKVNQTSHVLPFMLIDSSDSKSGKIGQAANLTIAIAKDGAGFAAPTGTVAEVGGTNNGKGWYTLTPSAADVNTLGPLLLNVTCPGCDPFDTEFLVVAVDPYSALATPTDVTNATSPLATSIGLTGAVAPLATSLGLAAAVSPLATTAGLVPLATGAALNTARDNLLNAIAALAFATPTNVTAARDAVLDALDLLIDPATLADVNAARDAVLVGLGAAVMPLATSAGLIPLATGAALSTARDAILAALGELPEPASSSDIATVFDRLFTTMTVPDSIGQLLVQRLLPLGVSVFIWNSPMFSMDRADFAIKAGDSYDGVNAPAVEWIEQSGSAQELIGKTAVFATRRSGSSTRIFSAAVTISDVDGVKTRFRMPLSSVQTATLLAGVWLFDLQVALVPGSVDVTVIAGGHMIVLADIAAPSVAP